MGLSACVACMAGRPLLACVTAMHHGSLIHSLAGIPEGESACVRAWVASTARPRPWPSSPSALSIHGVDGCMVAL